MKTLENYIQKKLNEAIKNPEIAENAYDQAFGAVEMFIIQNPNKEAKATILWWNTSIEFEKIIREN